jgi:hypothetical protein
MTEIQMIEEPCSKLQGVFDRKEVDYSYIRSLTPQPAKHCRQAEPAGNALAVAVQTEEFVRHGLFCFGHWNIL